MAKRKTGSSARGKRTEKKEEPILTDDEGIDYSDIPPLTDEQLARMKRAGPVGQQRGRPPFGPIPKQLIAMRLEPWVIKELKEIASQEGIGYQVLITQVLEKFLFQKKPLL